MPASTGDAVNAVPTFRAVLRGTNAHSHADHVFGNHRVVELRPPPAHLSCSHAYAKDIVQIMSIEHLLHHTLQMKSLKTEYTAWVPSPGNQHWKT